MLPKFKDEEFSATSKLYFILLSSHLRDAFLTHSDLYKLVKVLSKFHGKF